MAYPAKFGVPTRRVRANEAIRVPEVRVIGDSGDQIGVVPTREGLRLAQEAGLDLVEVAPNEKPPVCRIMDVGKYLYSLEKKERESRKKQKLVDVKEIKMTPKIGEHDYQTKLRSVRKFLERGDKVKLTLFFRGREITHFDIGKRLMERLLEDISDVGMVERNEGLERNTVRVLLMPQPHGKIKKAAS